jgi:fatty acid-binding protein DegV
MGVGFQAVAAARAAAAGRSIPEILSLLKDQLSRTHVFAALDTLGYLCRSGQMNGAVSTMGELLQIKPLLRIISVPLLAAQHSTTPAS